MAFNYTEDDANITALISARMDLNRIYTKLRGDTVEYDDIVNTTATSFTELISEDIQSVAGENQGAWQSAMMTCMCAHGVIDHWIEAIRRYREKIDDLRDEYDEAVKNADDSDDDAGSEQNAAAKAAYQELEGDAETCEDMLSEGPTPETVRKLIEAGHLGLAPYAVTEDFEYYPYDAEGGEDLAERIRDGNFEGDYEDLHDAAHALATRASEAAQNGKKLSDGELDFLEAVLGGTDEILLDLPDSFRGEGSEEYQGEITAMLGMAVVGLSHESTGGGHDRLPESVRNVAGGVNGNTAYLTGGPSRSTSGFDSWIEDVQGLDHLLEHARNPNGAPMELGQETSLKLTSAVSDVAGSFPNEHNKYDSSLSYRPDEEGNAAMSSLLDFSTANEDANHTLLISGEEYNGRDAKTILSDLYTFDWDDDGRAVAGLTDWIAEGEGSQHTDEPERSREALVGLVDIVTSEHMQEQLQGTGLETEGTSTTLDDDGNPKVEEFDWKDVSMGHLNPELAGGFADIFDAHIESFASLEGVTAEGAEEGFENSFDDGEALLDLESREAFAELIAGDEESANQMFESTLDYNEENLGEFMSTFNGAPQVDLARSSGTLWNIVDSAVTNEADNRLEQHNDQVDEENSRKDLVLGLVNSYNPHPQASAAVSGLGGDLLHDDNLTTDDAERGDSLPRNAFVYERAQIHALDALSDRGEGYEDLMDPRITPNNGNVSLNKEDWIEYEGERLQEHEEDFLEEYGRESQGPLLDSWNNVRNSEWPDDRAEEQKEANVSDEIAERGEEFDTTSDYVGAYTDEFGRYATD